MQQQLDSEMKNDLDNPASEQEKMIKTWSSTDSNDEETHFVMPLTNSTLPILNASAVRSQVMN
jgi:hypothetical protein